MTKKTAEQVLAHAAEYFHNEAGLGFSEMKALTAPYLPKPEPDRLTLAAEECYETHITFISRHDAIEAIRAIIAREVAAAEPSDAGINRMIRHIKTDAWTNDELRAALKGKSA